MRSLGNAPGLELETPPFNTNARVLLRTSIMPATTGRRHPMSPLVKEHLQPPERQELDRGINAFSSKAPLDGYQKHLPPLTAGGGEGGEEDPPRAGARAYLVYGVGRDSYCSVLLPALCAACAARVPCHSPNFLRRARHPPPSSQYVLVLLVASHSACECQALWHRANRELVTQSAVSNAALKAKASNRNFSFSADDERMRDSGRPYSGDPLKEQPIATSKANLHRVHQ